MEQKQGNGNDKIQEKALDQGRLQPEDRRYFKVPKWMEPYIDLMGDLFGKPSKEEVEEAVRYSSEVTKAVPIASYFAGQIWLLSNLRLHRLLKPVEESLGGSLKQAMKPDGDRVDPVLGTWGEEEPTVSGSTVSPTISSTVSSPSTVPGSAEPAKEKPNIKELRELAEKLVMLTRAPEPGCHTWHIAVHQTIDKIAAFHKDETR